VDEDLPLERRAACDQANAPLLNATKRLPFEIVWP
jgi:hypothetical protein